MRGILSFCLGFWGVFGLLSWLVPDRLQRRIRGGQDSMLASLARISTWSSKYAVMGVYRERAAKAGWSGHRGPVLLLFLEIILSLIGFILSGCVVAEFWPQCSIEEAGFVVFSGGFVAFSLGRCAVNVRTRRYQDELMRALPPLLDLLCLCFESGLGLHASLKRVLNLAPASSDALMHRIQMLIARLESGDRFQLALLAFQSGVEAAPVRRFAHLMKQMDRLGGEVSALFREESQELRSYRRHRAREMATKSAIWLMLPLILLELPALIILLMGPALVRFLNDFHGLLIAS